MAGKRGGQFLEEKKTKRGSGERSPPPFINILDQRSVLGHLTKPMGPTPQDCGTRQADERPRDLNKITVTVGKSNVITECIWILLLTSPFGAHPDADAGMTNSTTSIPECQLGGQLFWGRFILNFRHQRSHSDRHITRSILYM
ncbi:hypothetical protein SESBI_46999 [Sesbania bispinosa]|nr:hypothetical protein SESBI_46999 [Sesbania bispinosa]